ncbi:MAG: hypothetical protein U5L03_14065 [Burkholderiaceae bacterium]|nr:hypothetical protein [Burkholderiaceae bacterium]
MANVRRRLLLGALALPLAPALTGCIVAPYGAYYRPQSADPGARYKRAWCQGQAGPTTRVEFQLDGGVTLSARAERDYPERSRPELPLRLSLTLLGGVPARFEGERVQIVGADGAATDAPVTVLASGGVTLPADAWVDVTALRPAGVRAGAAADPHGRARIRVSGPAGFTPEVFSFEGPSVEVEGSVIVFPPLEVRRPASAGNPNEYRSAAEQASLEARAVACRRDTPQRTCQNLIEYGASRSFHFDSGPLQWQGRWFRAAWRPGEPWLDGELSLALREPRRWRFASNRISVREAAGAAQSLTFAQFDLRFVDRIALDAPLHEQRVEGRAETQVQIEALLPGDVGDFEVRLPPLRIGERRVAIAPIRFEKRSFDGGIEPFNC